MKRKSRFVKYSSSAVALLSTVLLASSGASAKDHKVKPSDNPAQVLAHISFSGLSAVDMTMQKQSNGKYTLYVQHAKDEGISIIDVSEPAHTRAIGMTPWPDPTASSRMNVTGNLAIIAENGTLPTRSVASDDNLVIWDLSNPSAPRVVQKFSGVVKWLQDDRHFIYVLNGEGLWVVSKPADRPQSESSFSYGG